MQSDFSFDKVQIKESEFETSFVVFPNDTNPHHTLFGGKIMSEMDIAGACVVRRALYSNPKIPKYDPEVVTRAAKEIQFVEPAFVGDLVIISTKIIEVGETSMTVSVKVKKQSKNGEVKQIGEGKFIFVIVVRDTLANNGQYSPLKHRLSL